MPHWLIEVGDLSPCIMLERSFNMSDAEPDCIISHGQGPLMPTGMQTFHNGEAQRKREEKQGEADILNVGFIFCLRSSVCLLASD